MVANLDIQGAMSSAQSAPVQMPHAGKTLDQTKKAAKDFESVFISQFLGSMFDGIKTDGMFGGGQGEQMFRSMMLDQYGKQLTAQGGFGLADSVTRSLIQHQESQRTAQQAAIDAASGKKPAQDDGIATQKTQPVFAAHPTTPTVPVKGKAASMFAAYAASAKAASTGTMQ